ncbi:S-layer like protein [[Synechococcus] sp. NIES-970]|nr:S-layer like protein [[Synechococcus] sp. NIES-970]
MSQATLSKKMWAIALASISCLLPLRPAQSQSIFGETEINPNNMAAIAVPLNSGGYNLLVVEQLERPDRQECWAETGSNPTTVEPLLLNFDFTGFCRRSTDSNGYSMRVGGEDFGQSHLLRIIPWENEMLLVATPNVNTQDEIVIGRTNGLADGFLKFNLLPGWEFTRRTFEDRPLGHFYFSSNGRQIAIIKKPTIDELVAGITGRSIVTLDSFPGIEPPAPETTNPDDPGVAARFTDISGDIYRNEIAQAVNVGFIAGFNDNTFRPNDVLTREQLVSMAIEGLLTIPNTNLNVPTQVASDPYPDVAADRWSAAKIAWARANNIVSGYPDGTFQPTQPVTRAELLAILRRTAEYAQAAQGRPTTLVATNNPVAFSDTETHWASALTTQMSAFCRVASPLNESGDRFFPDTASQRNYAAAATLRALQCSTR